jgi:tRNA(Ile)-lysidine synthase
MMTPVRTLDAALRRHGPVRRIGIALSGGGDSVALLHAAATLAKKRGFTVTAIHVFHGLRPSAENDALFCRRLCDELGLAFHRVDLDPSSFVGNVHDAAREARYRALEETAREQGLDLVLTAHTLDDQAETVLQRIIRGTGPTGLAAIRERRGVFLRPWLKLRRETLREYARENGLTWCEDPSNVNRRYLRTRLREKVLPVLAESAGDAVFAALGRLADLAAQETDVLDELAAEAMSATRSGDALLVAPLAALPPGRRALVLRRWLAERGVIPPRRVIDDLDHLLVSPDKTLADYRLPGRLVVHRTGNQLNWGDLPAVETNWEPFTAEGAVDRFFAAGRLHLVVGPVESNTPEKAQRVAFDDLRDARWTPPWPGARFQPRGMRGTVKCQDLFVNRKIPRPLRAVWPLLVRDGEILLAAGLRVGRKIEPPGDSAAWFVHLEW